MISNFRFRRIVILFLMSLLSFSATAQKKNLSLDLRGKIFGFVIIEDIYFVTATTGFELNYKNKHSVGLDGTLFRWSYQHDDDNDVEMYNQIVRRLYFLIDYKYYFAPSPYGNFYFNLYDKIGNKDTWWRKFDYPFGAQDMSWLNSTSSGTFNEFGIGIGLRRFFGTPKCGIDLSINIAQRFENEDIISVQNAVTTDYIYNQKSEKVICYSRLNLFYKFGGE